jgi:predicted transcriptional regulator
MLNLRIRRSVLGISQSKLARISGVSRFKICTFELGGGSLSEQECQRIMTALETEAVRIRAISLNPHFERGGQQEMR